MQYELNMMFYNPKRDFLYSNEMFINVQSSEKYLYFTTRI